MKRQSVRAALSFLFVVFALSVLAAQQPAGASSPSQPAIFLCAAQPSHNPDTVTGEELSGAAREKQGGKRMRNLNTRSL